MVSELVATPRWIVTDPETMSETPTLPLIVQALLRPTSYAHPAGDLQFFETHISWVVLAGPYAYKMKKPVNFGFLDFSMIEARLRDCVAEVELNRRICPETYRGIEWLVERDGAYHVGGAGRPIEPLVWMHRLPAEGMLTNLLANGEADRGLAQRIAHRLARFHAHARTGPDVDEHGRLATIRANWDENFAQTRAFVDRTISKPMYEAIQSYVDRFLKRERLLIERRVVEGRIRDGHGDLHASSVCVEGRHIHLFDCLEFADRFRCADVAAEVAFLAMDLDHHGRRDLAAVFVERYVHLTGDVEIPRLLDFYRCYRAYVRGKVIGFRLDEPALSSDQRATIATEAREYLDLAFSYASNHGEPRLVITMGLPASGKTTIARALSSRLGLVHISSDAVRKHMAGLPTGELHRDRFGEGLYGREITRRTYAAMLRQAERWLRRGQSVVLDATYGERRRRQSVERLADRLGVSLTVLVCQADEPTLVARLANRKPVDGIASDARLDLWPALRAAYEPPTELANAIAIDTSMPLDDAVASALSILRAAPASDAAVPRAINRSLSKSGGG